MALTVGDVVFVRGGKPAIITGMDDKSGRIFIDDNEDLVQKEIELGLKNGLYPEEKEAFKVTLHEVKNVDKHQEIENLYQKIQDLKQQNADGRLLRYLEGELAHQMARTNYYPKQVSVDPLTIGI